MHHCTRFMLCEISFVMNDPDYVRRVAEENGWAPVYAIRDARDGFCVGDFEETVRRLSFWDMHRFYTGHVLWYASQNEPLLAVCKTQDNIASALAYGKGSWWKRFTWWLVTGSRYRSGSSWA
jgi:hypothetical protein